MNDIGKTEQEGENFADMLSDEALDRTEFGKICSCGMPTFGGRRDDDGGTAPRIRP